MYQTQSRQWFFKGVSTGGELGRLIVHDHLYHLSSQPREQREALWVSNTLDVPLMETNFYLLREPTFHPEWSQDLVETITFPLASLFSCSFPV